MTNQEVFEAAARWIFKQGKPAVNGECCYYRSPDGMRCAIGGILPDEIYNPSMEGYTIEPILHGYVSVIPPKALERIQGFFKGMDVEFLYRLQRCHDEAVNRGVDPDDHLFLTRAKNRLKALADDYNLDTAVLDELTKKD